MTTTAFVALIDLSNLTVQFAADYPENTDLYTAGSAPELEDLTGPQAVALYNSLAAELNASPAREGQDPVAQVKRFADKGTATKRVWGLIELFQTLHAPVEEARKPMTPADILDNVIADINEQKAAPVAAPKASTARKTAGINLAPQKKVYACREGSKQATLVDFLSRDCGASMQELLRALAFGSKAWKEVTVKSGLNWDMNKIKGYGISTTFENGYERWLACDFESMDGFDLFDFDGHPDDNSDERKAELLQKNIDAGFDPSKRNVAVYHLVLPEGMTAPVPHTPKKGA